LAVLGEGPRGEKPKRAKRFLFRVNNPGEGDWLHVRMKSLERRTEVEAFWEEAQERRGDRKRSFDSREEEGFEGRIPRALRVERYLQGSEELEKAVERVIKP